MAHPSSLNMLIECPKSSLKRWLVTRVKHAMLQCSYWSPAIVSWATVVPRTIPEQVRRGQGCHLRNVEVRALPTSSLGGAGRMGAARRGRVWLKDLLVQLRGWSVWARWQKAAGWPPTGIPGLEIVPTGGRLKNSYIYMLIYFINYCIIINYMIINNYSIFILLLNILIIIHKI